MAGKSARRSGGKARQRPRGTARTRAARRKQMPFSRRNYVLLAIGMVVIVTGYVIMRLENEVDGFISLYVSPILLLIGYMEIIYAIWWRPKEETAESALSQ